MPATTSTGMPWEPPSAEELQRLLPQFAITSLLGRGGMGAVYRGVQISLDREVAIKLLPPELAADPTFEARFKREAKAMARLNHPNIVQIHDFGQTSEGHHYFVMEYVDGTDLHQLIRSGGLDALGALNAVSQICDALEYAHSEGFVHRDIKPANIFVNSKGILKVGDFGLAKLVETDPQRAASEALLTMTGVVMGTPQYIAPEQLLAEGHADQRADIYSLGVMFYEMLTGTLPRGAVHAPSESIKALDVRIDGVVFKAMEPDPGLRYQTAADLRTDVDVIRTTPAQDTPAPEKKRPRRKMVPMAVVVPLVLLVAAGLGLLVFQPWARKDLAGLAKGFVTTPVAATRDKPFINSLGMRFVPVPGTDVLMSVWETRVIDFDTFLNDTRYDWLTKAPWPQTPEHPVVSASWNDAKAFCAWLSTKQGLSYRLPSDEEWSAAVGSDRFPWGHQWPPPANAENISGEERQSESKSWLAGYRDAYPGTAPVGSYLVNRLGLYDMGGNAREFLEGWYDEPLYERHLAAGGTRFSVEDAADIKRGNVRRVVRGGGWFFSSPDAMLSMARGYCPLPDGRFPQIGFRVVVELGNSSKTQIPGPEPVATVSSTQPPASEEAWKNAVNLLKLVELPGDALKGQWKLRDGMPVVNADQTGGQLAFPYRPPAEYDFRVKFLSLQGEGIVQTMVKDGHPFSWMMGIPGGDIAGFEVISGQNISISPARRSRTAMVSSGKPHISLVEVRNDGLRGYLDGELLAEWKTDFHDMDVHAWWTVPDGTPMAVGTWKTNLQVIAAEVREVTGKGIFLRSQSKMVPAGNTQAAQSLDAQFAGVTKDKPFVNSLGMKFVPVPGTDVLFCIHETRWRDYAEYAKANPGIDPRWQDPPAWRNQNVDGFGLVDRRDEHPVVFVNWADANCFCEWLSEKETKTYRLPTDREWSVAVGLTGKEKWRNSDTPESINKDQTEFPWGRTWPPPRGAGNYCDESCKANAPGPDTNTDYVSGYDDGYPTSAPVMSFNANDFGLYDIGGNVWEWVEDWWNPAKKERVLRGGSWTHGDRISLLSSRRVLLMPPAGRHPGNGFRVVLDASATP